MIKVKFVNVILVVALVLGGVGTVWAADSGSVSTAPTLKLAVTRSPLAIYPPVMLYTAQLSNAAPTSTAQWKVDYYHLAGTGLVYLGSAPVDSTGQAVLSKQMSPGTYTAIARVVINQQVIWSNKVIYTVP